MAVAEMVVPATFLGLCYGYDCVSYVWFTRRRLHALRVASLDARWWTQRQPIVRQCFKTFLHSLGTFLDLHWNIYRSALQATVRSPERTRSHARTHGYFQNA